MVRSSKLMSFMLAGSFMVAACTRQGEPSREETSRRAGRVIAPVAQVETIDGWLDLIAQRPSAVLGTRGRVLIDLGHASAHKHVALSYRDTMRVGEWVEGRAAGVVVGRTSAIDIPVAGQHAVDAKAKVPMALAIEAQELAPNQSMTVLWNERPIAHVPLEERWRRTVVSVPADVIVPGENRVRLHFRRTQDEGGLQRAAALGRVEFGPASDLEAALKRTQVYKVRSESLGQAQLELLGSASLAYAVLPPPRARLDLELSGTGVVEVRASNDEDHAQGRPPTVVFRDTLQGGTRRAEIDLSAWGEVPVWLELSVGPRAAAITVREAMITVRREKPKHKARGQARDLYVVAIEGARADAFAAGAEPAMPNLEALREQALVFENAYTTSPVAVAAHASWLSSVAAPIHRTVRGTFVADRQSLLSELLDRTDHYRVLVAANGSIEADRGLTQGIDGFFVRGDEIGEDGTAAGIFAHGLELLGKRRDPAFLYAVVRDPLPPYDPPRAFFPNEKPPRGAPSPHMSHVWVGRVKLHQRKPSSAEVDYVRALYRGELLAVDQALGALSKMVEEKPGSVLVVLGIHGQEFYEHESAGYGRTLYEEALRVPLFIHAPGVVAAKTVEAPVDLLDLTPTLAELFGLPAPDAWQGESLLTMIEDPLPPPRLVQSFGSDDASAGVVARRKLIVGPGRVERYFDLEHDPGEREDRVADGGIGLRMLRNSMAWHLAYEKAWRRSRWGTGANLRAAFALDQGM